MRKDAHNFEFSIIYAIIPSVADTLDYDNKGGASVTDYFVAFLISVMGSIVAAYIFKWLNRDE